MKRIPGRPFAAIATALLALHAGLALAADLKVFSTIALRESWPELQPKFEARGHKLELVLNTSGALGKMLNEGAAGDVIVSTTAGVDGLAKSGKTLAGTNRAFGGSAIGVAVLRGAPKPDISTPEAFRQALLAAKSVAYSDPAGGGASGAYFSKVLERLGIADQVNAKAKRGRGIPNAEFVVKGESDLAIQQIPELMGVSGVEVVGPFPGDLHNVTSFAAAVLATSRNVEAARALVEFLASPETKALLKSRGFEVAP
jgi:molybdate transport system substrate-binding protein